MPVNPLVKPPFNQSILNPTHHLARDVELLWLFNEEIGSNLHDKSKNGNAGTVTGAVWGAGGLTLDGTDDLISVARLTGLTNWMTWVRYTPDAVDVINPIVDQGDILIKQQDDDILYGVTSNLEIDYNSIVTACLTAGSPVDILVTRDGTTMVCYVYDTNGKLYTDTFVVAGTANSSRTNLVLGSNSRTTFLYQDMRPTDMTDEKSLIINASDDVQYAKGSRSLNSATITECWNANQLTILIWIDPLNFTPGDRISHYLFENKGTSTATNRVIGYITGAGTLTFFIRDKDSTSHSVTADVSGWAIGEKHQIFMTIDFAADAMALYVDGALEDNAGHDLSSDSISEIEATVHVGSGSSGTFQVNSGMTIHVFDRVWSLAEITANYDSDAGTPFVCDPDTILSTIPLRDDDTGIIWHHSGMYATASNTAGEITDVTGCETRFAVDDAVNFYGGCGDAITGPCIVMLSSGTRVRVHSGTAFASISGGQKFYQTDASFPESGITGANDLTLQGWIFIPDTVGLKFIVTKWGAAGDRMYNFGLLADALYFTVSDDGTGGYYSYSTAGIIEADKWFHVAAVYDASEGTVDFYINGHFINQGDNLDTSIADKAPPFTIGTWSGDTSNYTGGIFNIALFDDKRTGTEILASANDWDIDLSGEGNIIGQWMFNEAAAAAAIDNLQGDAGRDLIPWDSGDVTFADLRSVTGGYVQDVEKIGVSMNCDSTYYAQGGDALNPAVADFSISMRLKFDGNRTGITYLFNKGISAAEWFAIRITNNGQKIEVMLRDADDGTYALHAFNGSDLGDNRWHHIAITFDRDSNATLYLDGYSDGTPQDISAHQAAISPAQLLYIGSYNEGTLPHDGWIGDFKFYDAGLWSAAQIIYQATHPHDVGASAGTITEYFPFTENTGTTTHSNVTLITNDLTLSSADAWDQAAYISKNLLITDENGGIGGISGIDSTWTVSKDTTTKFKDSRSLKAVNAAGDDNDEFTIASPTLVTNEDYWHKLWVFPSAIHDDSKLYLDVDGAATPITSREIGKSLGDNGHFAREFNLDATYYAQAANNGVHDIALQDIGIWAWVKVNSDATSYGFALDKWTTLGGYSFGYDSDGAIVFYISDADSDAYTITGNTDIRDDEWHFIAGIIDKSNANNCKLYLDGAEDGTTNKSGTLASVGSLTTTGTMGFSKRLTGTPYLFDGYIAEVGIAYPADIMAAGEMGEAGAIAAMYANPFDLTQYPNFEDRWPCTDNAANTTVTGAVNDLTASANTEDFAEEHWKRYDICYQADQTDISHKLRITGAGAGTNSATVYVDDAELRVNMVQNGGCED